MATSHHQAAIFEEGFVLVAVSPENVADYGEKTMWETIQGHAWVVEQGIPVVIVYRQENGPVRAYGDSELVAIVAQLDFDAIVWGHELTLEW
jgi:hypothetical protein